MCCLFTNSYHFSQYYQLSLVHACKRINFSHIDGNYDYIKGKREVNCQSLKIINLYQCLVDYLSFPSQVMPILKLLYNADDHNAHHIYMSLIILLILSQDDNFNKSVHELVRVYIPFMLNSVLSIPIVSLATTLAKISWTNLINHVPKYAIIESYNLA